MERPSDEQGNVGKEKKKMIDPFCYNPKCQYYQIRDIKANKRGDLNLGSGRTIRRHRLAYNLASHGEEANIREAFVCEICAGVLEIERQLKAGK